MKFGQKMVKDIPWKDGKMKAITGILTRSKQPGAVGRSSSQQIVLKILKRHYQHVCMLGSIAQQCAMYNVQLHVHVHWK